MALDFYTAYFFYFNYLFFRFGFFFFWFGDSARFNGLLFI